MSWQRRYFKGKEVWVKVNHLGDPIIDEGRVEMRYQNAEDAKVYRASPRNISAQPADLQDATDAFEAKEKTRSSSSGTKSAPLPITMAESPGQWGPRRESTEIPDELRDYPVPPDGIIEVYTDGACSGNPGPSGYGVVIRYGQNYREISQYLGQGTNNIAELTAIRVALETLKETDQNHHPVHLHSDSTYSIGVLTKGWKAKANRELILSIRNLLTDFSDLTFFKVKGHSDHPLNDRADFLATSSLDQR